MFVHLPPQTETLRQGCILAIFDVSGKCGTRHVSGHHQVFPGSMKEEGLRPWGAVEEKDIKVCRCQAQGRAGKAPAGSPHPPGASQDQGATTPCRATAKPFGSQSCSLRESGRTLIWGKTDPLCWQLTLSSCPQTPPSAVALDPSR